MNDWWRDELAQRENTHMLRRLRTLPSGVLDLASNDYLGLARHPEVIAASCAAAREFSAGARASRLVSGHTSIHEQLETELARFKNCEATLVFPSGFQANLAVVTALARSGDFVYCDKRNHASLIDACLLAKARGANVRFYDSLPKLRALLDKSTPDTTRLIVSDAVYSMDGDLAAVPELLELVREFESTLILDDAHGNGTLGASGRGALEYYRQSSIVNRQPSIVQTGTFSKAFGSQGGFVAGSRVLIDWLVNSARSFIYTTGLNPAACGAALAALQIIEREPQRLKQLQDVTQKLAQGLSTLGFDARSQPSPIIAIILGEAERAVQLSEKLLERGVWCPAIRPPTVPQGSSRLRVTASADLTDEQIQKVLTAFTQCR